jgi:low temperature requirement protein LtrA
MDEQRMTSGDRGLLRTRGEHEHGKVTFVELFFDLVFVFAVTQLSHSLLQYFTVLGIVQTTLLLMAVWWVWIYTTWVTNWLDPDKVPVRLMLFALMLAGLVLSTSIPEAFEGKALAFAGAYIFMQLGRSLFTLWALRGHSPSNYRNFQRINAWLAMSAIFWIAGAQAEGELRLGLWVVALGIEYVAPSLGFWTPGFGRSTTADWDVEGGHMAERCALFIIIALGEAIVVTGATTAALDLDTTRIVALALAFLRLKSRFDGGPADWGSFLLVDDMPNLVAVIVVFVVLALAGLFVAARFDHGGLHDGGVALFIASGLAVFLSLKHVFDNLDRQP